MSKIMRHAYVMEYKREGDIHWTQYSELSILDVEDKVGMLLKEPLLDRVEIRIYKRSGSA